MSEMQKEEDDEMNVGIECRESEKSDVETNTREDNNDDNMVKGKDDRYEIIVDDIDRAIFGWNDFESEPEDDKLENEKSLVSSTTVDIPKLLTIETREEKKVVSNISAVLKRDSSSVWNNNGGSMKASININSLPDDILVIIFGYVNFGTVCHRWLACQTRVYRNMTFETLHSKCSLPLELAAAIECCLFMLYKTTVKLESLRSQLVSKQYKQHAKRLLYNLKKNEELREKVVAGEIPPEELVNTSPDQLATKAIQTLRSDAAMISLKNASRKRVQYPISKIFFCPICSHDLSETCILRRKPIIDRYTIVAKCLKCFHVWEP